MKCNLFVVSQLSLVDFQSKFITAINILEDFQTVTFPTAIQAVVSFIIYKETGDPTETQVNINVSIGETQLITNHLVQLNFNENSRGIKSITTFGSLVLNHAGELKFSLHDAQNNIIATFSVVVTSTVSSTETNAEPQVVH